MWPFKKKEKHFKVGDLIKCIDDRGWNNGSGQSLNLVYGKTYKVLMVVKCPTCGTISYDIGSKFINSNCHTTCSGPPSKHELPAVGIHLAGHFRFAKSGEEQLENREEIEAELEKCLQYEDYEKAVKLRDKLVKINEK